MAIKLVRHILDGAVMLTARRSQLVGCDNQARVINMSLVVIVVLARENWRKRRHMNEFSRKQSTSSRCHWLHEPIALINPVPVVSCHVMGALGCHTSLRDNDDDDDGHDREVQTD